MANDDADARWIQDFEATRFRLCAPGRERRSKQKKKHTPQRAVLKAQKRPGTTPNLEKNYDSSLREAEIEMLWKGKSSSSSSRQLKGHSFTKSGRFEEQHAKAPSITSYIQHLKNKAEIDTNGLKNATLGNNSENSLLNSPRISSVPHLTALVKPKQSLGPGAYISASSHDIIDSKAPTFSFGRAGSKRHFKQGRACFDIPKSQMDPVTLKCPRGMVSQLLPSPTCTLPAMLFV